VEFVNIRPFRITKIFKLLFIMTSVFKKESRSLLSKSPVVFIHIRILGEDFEGIKYPVKMRLHLIFSLWRFMFKDSYFS